MGRRVRVMGAAVTVLAAAVAAAAITLAAQTAEKHAITFKDLISFHRVSEPQISPDGKWIAYSVATPDLETNHSVRDIWVVPAAGGGG
jgi:acylaminoacyl-peptidase